MRRICGCTHELAYRGFEKVGGVDTLPSQRKLEAGHELALWKEGTYELSLPFKKLAKCSMSTSLC